MVLSPTKSKKPPVTKQAPTSRSQYGGRGRLGLDGYPSCTLLGQICGGPVEPETEVVAVVPREGREVRGEMVAAMPTTLVFPMEAEQGVRGCEVARVVNPFIHNKIDLVITDRAEWGGAVQKGVVGSPLYAGQTPRPSPSPSPLPHLFSPAASPAGNSRGSNFSPATLDSPGESNGGGRRQPKSRAEAMLERVRSQPQFITKDPLIDAQNWGLTIWGVEKISKLLLKIAHSLKKSCSDSPLTSSRRKSDSGLPKVKVRTGKFFLKIEATDRQHRPSYKDLPCWPSINLDSEPGTSPFVLKPASNCKNQSKPELKVNKDKKETPAPSQCKGSKPVLRRSPRKRNSPTKVQSPLKRNACAVHPPRKGSNFVFQDSESLNLVPPRPPSKRHPERSLFPEIKKETDLYEPLPGYCEICKVDYQDLRRHCQTQAHKEYALNVDNYAQLDCRINSQSLNLEAFYYSLFPVNTRSSEPEDKTSPLAEKGEDADSNVTASIMRQPVDDRNLPSKMVGRKETLEVQCNGISNHVQTRFTCNKGDRENINGIFLDERLTASQIRKKRSISVSCKDLLEIAPGNERTHYLRSGRPARSELSQLSPALSDNSHPLLNSNSQQPLLSPTLSERGHNLRTRSQLWNNVIEEDPLPSPNNAVELHKPDKLIDKVEHPEKGEKSEKVEFSEKSGSQEFIASAVPQKEESEKEAKESNVRELRPPRTHSRNRSIRRKRLSAEEKLIEDNRGYYKVEVLNSKLRSTGYFVQSNQADGTVNGECPSSVQNRTGSQEEKEPVVVRFKKVRRSELSVLSDEAENFMFGEQTRSETNSENSTESDDEEEEGEEDEEEDEDGGEDDDESGGTDSNGLSENGTDSSRSRSSQRNGRRSSSSRRGREQPNRIRLKVGSDGNYKRCSAGESGSSSQLNSSETNGFRKCRKRRTQAEAFINDNSDYYKFELAGSRLRVHGSPTASRENEDSPNPEKSKIPGIEDLVLKEIIDGTPCPVDNLHFSFESVPSSEVWFHTFQRQDRGDELVFPVVGEPSAVILPYQLPRRDMGIGQRSVGKRRSKNSVRLPRKSPRCHASTLAILSSVVKRRSSKEPEIVATTECVPNEAAPSESKNATVKQPQSGTQAQASEAAKSTDHANGEEEIQVIARNIDSMLGLVPGSSSDVDKEAEVSQPKSYVKGRSRKKQTVKPIPSSLPGIAECVPESDRDRDPSLHYLIDPAILDELSCTCDVVSDPRGGPAIDFMSLLDSYSDCCCIVEESSADLGIDASCNSSECGTSSTCEADRRLKKKRKRRNMTGWDKPKRRCILRRDVLGAVPEEVDNNKEQSSKGSIEEPDSALVSPDSESSVVKLPNSISSPPSFKRKCGIKRKLRSSLSITDSSRKSNGPGQPRINVIKIEKDGEVSVPSKKGKCRKVRRIGWSKAR
ncbi:Protein chiffon [Frankliniella fusca]|uniref:Protein chiffon n=1 Tax=Frankliniella fusca TaxID=407009 RepID=A0AAE1HZ69_9NEOP|nr:Protein chiffon [Frankliniella fusca]